MERHAALEPHGASHQWSFFCSDANFARALWVTSLRFRAHFGQRSVKQLEQEREGGLVAQVILAQAHERRQLGLHRVDDLFLALGTHAVIGGRRLLEAQALAPTSSRVSERAEEGEACGGVERVDSIDVEERPQWERAESAASLIGDGSYGDDASELVGPGNVGEGGRRDGVGESEAEHEERLWS
eukprot:6752309-Prymnesium_polylepis.1